MSERGWTGHDVTDGRLLMYAASLWLMLVLVLLYVLEIAVAVDAAEDIRPQAATSIATVSMLLLLLGVYYERIIDGGVRLIVWLNKKYGLEVPTS
jgi:uncharacterized protein involved in response to NO